MLPAHLVVSPFTVKRQQIQNAFKTIMRKRTVVVDIRRAAIVICLLICHRFVDICVSGKGMLASTPNIIHSAISLRVNSATYCTLLFSRLTSSANNALRLEPLRNVQFRHVEVLGPTCFANGLRLNGGTLCGRGEWKDAERQEMSSGNACHCKSNECIRIGHGGATAVVSSSRTSGNLQNST